MAEPVSIVLVGLGGYGKIYLSALLDGRDDARFRVVGAVDPRPEKCSRMADVHALGIPVYPSLAEFYQKEQADLAVISSPIHKHCEQTCEALQHGSNVLCEKPAAATVQEVDRMIQAQERAGKGVAIGYQWSFSQPIQQLKRNIQTGRFGAPRRFKSLCLWSRGENYYRRNDWAGRLRDAAGNWVLDSPVNNAMAHDLHNMLYVLGEREDTSALPAEIVAELHRANAIESLDTAALRAHTEAGVEILFYGSHAVANEVDPMFTFELDHATIEFAGGSADIVARCADGTVRRYSSPNSVSQVQKLWTCVAAVRGDGDIPCGLEAARAHTLCVNGAHDSMPQPVDFPVALRRVADRPAGRLVHVGGLPDVLRECYARAVLPSELGTSWSRPGQVVSLRGYQRFPGGA